MGLFDFISNEFIEVIDWVDSSSDTIMWKFQDKGNNIKNEAKLTVREGQVAVLMNEGEFGDVYLPGLHTLSTNNMPITTTLKSWKYKFNSPFKVDIYFVNTKLFTNLKWGTSGPIFLKDAEFGQVRLKSYGSFAIRINDSKKFITEFAGTNPYVRVENLEETLKNTIASKMPEVYAEAKISVMELASNFSEIGGKIIPILQEDFDTYGITIEKFFIESISLPEEVEKIIDKKKQLNILKGNLNDYNQLQSGTALEKLADNDGAGNMAGMGAGVILTNLMSQSGQQQNNTESKENLLKILEQLGELKTKGILSEDEFNQKKLEILAKL